MIATTRLTEVFVEMADTLVANFDLVEFLTELTERAAEVSGADAVGLVLADHRGGLEVMAATTQSGMDLELFQIAEDEGPCLDSYRSRQPVVNAELKDADHLWPRFAPHARSLGFRSVHAFPMRLRDDAVGALNLFGGEPLRLDPVDVGIVQALADIATIALLQQRTLARAEALTEQLQGALNSRVVVEQAKGALAQRAGISVVEAFEVMRQRARTERRRLLEVAEDVLQER